MNSPAGILEVVPDRLREASQGRSGPACPKALGNAWQRSLAPGASTFLLSASVALLFLDAAGTIEFVYTLTVSHLLILAACVTGAPFILEGWKRVPAALRLLAGLLLLVYVFGAVTGDQAVLASAERAGSYRDVVYVADLALGLAVIGLVVGRCQVERSLRPLVICLFAGAGAAASYGVYQALALEFGWPLTDVNNAVNSDLVSYGYKSQGTGVLGFERVRGTFTEPHFFGSYLSALAPTAVAVWSFLQGRRARGLLFAAVGALAASMVLTASLPAWGILAAGSGVTLVVYGVARGLVTGAAVAGAALATTLMVFSLPFVSPQSLAAASGRSADDIRLTTEFRTDGWSRVIDLWSTRPVLGYGPGQGSIRLARGLPNDQDQVVLGTTQGLWAAALIDAGILGFATWALFLGSALWLCVRALLLRQTPTLIALSTAAVVAVFGSQITGDRLELRVWVVLALAIAAATAVLQTPPHTGESHAKGHADRHGARPVKGP